MIIGICGRTGSGKTYAQKLLEKKIKALYLDLDIIGHYLLEKTSVKKKILTCFPAIIFENEKINRKTLGNLVFNDSSLLKKLNQIIHPLIKKEVLKSIKLNSDKTTIFLIGALIDEIGLKNICDKIIVISAEDTFLLQNNEEKFNLIRSHQKSKEEYLKMADFIINNSFNAQFEKDIVNLIKKIIK